MMKFIVAVGFIFIFSPLFAKEVDSSSVTASLSKIKIPDVRDKNGGWKIIDETSVYLEDELWLQVQDEHTGGPNSLKLRYGPLLLTRYSDRNGNEVWLYTESPCDKQKINQGGKIAYRNSSLDDDVVIAFGNQGDSADFKYYALKVYGKWHILKQGDWNGNPIYTPTVLFNDNKAPIGMKITAYTDEGIKERIFPFDWTAYCKMFKKTNAPGNIYCK